MQNPIQHIIHENIFWLSAERCLYWEEENALIVADLHFGKTGHFRKSGLAVPQQVYKEDLQRLVSQLQYFKPQQLIIAGDLFHSEANRELELFSKWRKDFPRLKIRLIKGNHDILDDEWYKKTEIEITAEELVIHEFSFRHDLSQPRRNTPGSQRYTFSGHVHPGISIRGAARQTLRFPCFYFAKDFAVLPAFSRFTGTHRIEPKKNETVFAIVENGIIQVA
jgi:DNA ligase-associated metallophosphoesterase